jgi:hypothetical protein
MAQAGHDLLGSVAAMHAPAGRVVLEAHQEAGRTDVFQEIPHNLVAVNGGLPVDKVKPAVG